MAPPIAAAAADTSLSELPDALHRPSLLDRFARSVWGRGERLWQTAPLYPTGVRPSHRVRPTSPFAVTLRQPHAAASAQTHQNQEFAPAVAVKIKLKRIGKMREPHYRIVVADARTARGGRAIEEIGQYHPLREPLAHQVDSERAQYWLGVGAQPTEAVAAILRVTGDWQAFKGEPAPPRMLMAEPKADKRLVFEAAAKEAAGLSEKAATTPKAKKASRQAKAAAKADEPKAEAAPKAAEPSRGSQGRGPRPRRPRPRSPPSQPADAPAEAAAEAAAETDAERMIEQALEHLVRGIVDHPDDVRCGCASSAAAVACTRSGCTPTTSVG